MAGSYNGTNESEGASMSDTPVVKVAENGAPALVQVPV